MFNGTNEMSEFNSTFNYTPVAMDYNFNNPFNKLHIRVTFIILYTLIFLCCFFGNLIVLFVIIRTGRIRARTHFFLANLAAADLCVDVCCVYPTLSMYISPIWHLGRTNPGDACCSTRGAEAQPLDDRAADKETKVMCKVYYFAHHMSLTIPVVLISVISIERYVATLYPLKAKELFTFRRLRVTQVLIWLLLAAYNAPQLIVHDTYTLGGKTFCYMRTDSINTHAYVLANLIVWYILPLFILSFMYFKIVATLRKSSSTQNVALNPQRNQQLIYKSDNFQNNHHHNNHHDTSQHMSDENFANASNQIYTGVVCTPCPEVSRPAECIEMTDMDSPVCSIPKSRLCHCNSIVSQVQKGLEYMPDATDGENNPDTYTNENGVRVNICVGPVDEKMKNKLNDDYPPDHPKRSKRRCPTREEARRSEYKVNSICRSNNARFVTSGVPSHYYKRRPCVDTQKVVQAREKAIRLILMIIITFAILALPYHIMKCIYLWVDTKHIGSLFSPICYLLYYTNSSLNPFLYAFLSGNFRKRLKDSFKCFTRK